MEYVDTPGLDDILTGEQAVEEISKAFRVGGPFKLFFVCTLEAGALRPTDVSVIRTVSRAIQLQATDTSIKYGVVVNKCSQTELQQFDNADYKLNISRRLGIEPTKQNPLLIKLEPTIDSVSNTLLRGKEEYNQFVDALPVFSLPQHCQVKLSAGDLEEQLRKEIPDLQKKTVQQETVRDPGCWCLFTYFFANGTRSGQ